MALESASKEMVREIGRIIGHGAAIVGGLVMMFLGLAMGVSLVLLPIGVPIGLLGLAVFFWGLFAREPEPGARLTDLAVKLREAAEAIEHLPVCESFELEIAITKPRSWKDRKQVVTVRYDLEVENQRYEGDDLRDIVAQALEVEGMEAKLKQIAQVVDVTGGE